MFRTMYQPATLSFLIPKHFYILLISRRARHDCQTIIKDIESFRSHDMFKTISTFSEVELIDVVDVFCDLLRRLESTTDIQTVRRLIRDVEAMRLKHLRTMALVYMYIDAIRNGRY